jgi:hypothetical protein
MPRCEQADCRAEQPRAKRVHFRACSGQADACYRGGNLPYGMAIHTDVEGVQCSSWPRSNDQAVIV